MSLRPLLLAAALAISAIRLDAQTVTIDNVTIVDVATGRLQVSRNIAIEGNRIIRITAATPATHAAATLDGTGMYVIPGLWDMHVHAYFTNDSARFHSTSEAMFPLFIASGITGVRDLGSNLDAVLAARDSIASHRLVGPRMLVAGPMLDGPTTRYAAVIKVSAPEDARAAVRLLKGRGVDMIKTQSLVPKDAYFAIADEAARLGIPFEGHVPNAITGREAMNAHQRSFEHLLGVSDTDAALIADLAKFHVWQCPTLLSDVGTAADLAADPGLAFWLKGTVDGWRRTANRQLNATDSAARAVAATNARRLALVRRMHAAGIPFLAGTDAPAGFDLTPGSSLHRELQLLVQAGFTPLQALQTATLNPASFFGKSAEWGSVTVGKVADLVVLARNPLIDIANTRAVMAVIADGRYYSPRELDRLRLKVMEAVAK